MRVLAAMSGGVDSSVAAAMMVESGHEVTAVTLKLWEGPDGAAPTAGCCTVSDAEDARRVAAQLGVPYYVLDYVEPFRRGVVEPFISEYLAGRTPNPCIECNRVVKFDLLVHRARELRCDIVVTGHYARIRRSKGGLQLLRSVDRAKDQSYVLYMLSQRELSVLRFPVGGMTKEETRQQAARLGLRTAGKKDSQDVCFVGSGDYRAFLRRSAPETAGAGRIVDLTGTEVGTHAGISSFTIGQRRGLGAGHPDPRYVVEIRPELQEIVVGSRASLMASGLQLARPSWVAGIPPEASEVEVKIRYRSQPMGARLAETSNGTWEVSFDDPQPAVTPGQAAVLYVGDVVLGGGTIDAVIR